MNLTVKDLTNLIAEDPRSLLDFYRQVRPILTRYFSRRVNNLEDQEELVQDTLMSILDSLPQFKQEASFKTWVYRIAQHEVVDYYRRKKIKSIVFSKLPFLKHIVDKALGPQLRLEEIEAKQRIFQTFKNLSEGYARVLRLRYIEGLTVTEIASRLGLSYKACESRLSRARLAFQLEFVRNGPLVPEAF